MGNKPVFGCPVQMIMRVRIRQEGKKRAVCDYEGLGGIALSLKEGPYFKDLGPKGVPKMALGVPKSKF